MRALSFHARLLIVGTALLAGLVLVTTFHGVWTPSVVPALLGAIVLFTAARLRPVDLSHSLRFNLCASVAFAVLLALGEPIAVWGAAIGTVAAAVLPRWGCPCRWYQTLFNAATYVLAIAAAALVYAPFDDGFPLLRTLDNALGLVLAAGAFFLVNAGLMTAVVALAQHQEFLSGWFLRLRQLAPLYAGLLISAAIAVVIYSYSPLASVVMIMPLLAMYMTTRATFTIRAETKRALEALASEIDARDHYTARHSERVALYAGRVAGAIGGLSSHQIDVIVRAARIHDVGKLSIPTSLINKPGPLTPDEQAEMQRHAEYGAQFIGRFSDYREGRDLILYHHEHYDGSGYPCGLRGEQIPLGARILAVADAFDAMTSTRPYRAAMSYERAAFELRRMAGKQFDPRVVEVFLKVIRPEDLASTEAVRLGLASQPAPLVPVQA